MRAARRSLRFSRSSKNGLAPSAKRSLQPEWLLARAMHARGGDLAADLERALSQAFDTADVSRLRDRERLHIIVDRAVAAVTDEFARGAARAVGDEIDAAVARAEAIVAVSLCAR